jgi:mannose-6-phosphate isomerase
MNPPLPDVLPLQPYLLEIVWGGRRLQTFGKELPAHVPIGESFEVSALPEQDSVVSSGDLSGLGLREVLSRYGQELVGAAVTAHYGDDFPLLIKLIDAQQDLSIQVHPDDAYARAEDLGRFGKTEAWYVLHSDGAELALGLRQGTDAAELRQALIEGRAKDAVLYQEVAPDDVVFLKAGTVHALCRGVMVYEVQQSSDLTFRLYDYGRPGLDGQPRELHLERGLAVTDFTAAVPHPQAAPEPGPEGALLVDAEEFTLTLCGAESDSLSTAQAFAAVTVIAGAGKFAGVELDMAQTALIPAGRDIHITAAGADLRYLVAAPGVGRQAC